MALNPMHQFEVYKIGPGINIGGINLSFTNASFFMAISAILNLSLLFFGTKKKSLIPSKIQLITEMSYALIAIKKLAFVKERFMPPIFISGPIL